LIILSIIAFSISTIPDLSLTTVKYLRFFEILSVIVFTIEYLLRIYIADRKLSFIFSLYGIIDLCAILPFYILRSVDLRSIRIFRLFRLFRVLKIFRYNNAIKRFILAIKLIKPELIVFGIAAFGLLYVASIGIYYFEHEVQPDVFASFFHCMWWAIVTLTTVGYGDSIPITVGGKIFTSIIMFIGLGIVAVPTGLIASALTRTINND